MTIDFGGDATDSYPAQLGGNNHMITKPLDKIWLFRLLAVYTAADLDLAQGFVLAADTLDRAGEDSAKSGRLAATLNACAQAVDGKGAKSLDQALSEAGIVLSAKERAFLALPIGTYRGAVAIAAFTAIVDGLEGE